MASTSDGPAAQNNTFTIGGPIDSVIVSLCLYGDDLDPDKVTALLGCQPTQAARKGEPLIWIP